jgi:hypothetical protein
MVQFHTVKFSWLTLQVNHYFSALRKMIACRSLSLGLWTTAKSRAPLAIGAAISAAVLLVWGKFFPIFHGWAVMTARHRTRPIDSCRQSFHFLY